MSWTKGVLGAALWGLTAIPTFAEQQIKVMTYNVLLGFHSNNQLQQNRLDAAKKIIKRANPDILLLQEAFYAAPNATGIFVDYQKEFSYPYGATAVWGGYGGNVILSKYPITEKVILPLGSRTALRTKTEINGHLLTVDNIHLSPYITEQEKVAQLERIILNDSCSILGGDFNALSPKDSYSREDLLPDFLSFYGVTGGVMVDDWLTCNAIKYVLSQNLYDSSPSRYTYPTDYLTKNKQGAIRIDFLFHSKEMTTQSSLVETSQEAELASDHYPVISVLGIK